jgi:hypothetical protein
MLCHEYPRFESRQTRKSFHRIFSYSEFSSYQHHSEFSVFDWKAFSESVDLRNRQTHSIELSYTEQRKLSAKKRSTTCWLIIIMYYIDFSNFSEPKNKFSQNPFWWSHKYFAYMSIIIKQTYCQNLRVKSAIVLVLFKLLCCSIEKFRTILTILLIIILKHIVKKGYKAYLH